MTQEQELFKTIYCKLTVQGQKRAHTYKNKNNKKLFNTHELVNRVYL